MTERRGVVPGAALRSWGHAILAPHPHHRRTRRDRCKLGLGTLASRARRWGLAPDGAGAHLADRLIDCALRVLDDRVVHRPHRAPRRGSDGAALRRALRASTRI